VSPVEQDTIDYEYLAYFEPKIIQKKYLMKEILWNILVRTQQYDFKILLKKDLPLKT
jgi:hypothetical protein